MPEILAKMKDITFVGDTLTRLRDLSTSALDLSTQAGSLAMIIAKRQETGDNFSGTSQLDQLICQLNKSVSKVHVSQPEQHRHVVNIRRLLATIEAIRQEASSHKPDGPLPLRFFNHYGKSNAMLEKVMDSLCEKTRSSSFSPDPNSSYLRRTS